jgi:hypothetical protein
VGSGVGSPLGGAVGPTTATAAGFLASRGGGGDETAAITGGARVTVTVTETGEVASVAGGGVVVVTVTGGVVVVFMGSGLLVQY